MGHCVRSTGGLAGGTARAAVGVMHVPGTSNYCHYPQVTRLDCLRWCVRSPYCPPPEKDTIAPDPLSAPPTGRKLYAPPPVGQPTPVNEDPPPDTQRVVRIDYFYLTNAGESLDVLA